MMVWRVAKKTGNILLVGLSETRYFWKKKKTKKNVALKQHDGPKEMHDVSGPLSSKS